MHSEAYLTPDDIGELIDGARRIGKGWVARCPTHDDASPSLRIDDGHSCTLIYCHAGCTLDDICEALDIKREMLFHDYDHRTRGNDGIAEKEMIDFLRSQRPRTMEELMPLITVEQVLREAIDASPERWAWVGNHWGDILRKKFADVYSNYKEWTVLLEALCADLIADRTDEGYNYTVREQKRLGVKLRDTWNNGQS